MRIALVTESFLPAVNGVTTSVRHIAHHCAERGHHLTLIAPGPTVETYAGFPVVPVPAVTLRGFRLGMPGPALTAALERSAPDVLHAAAPFGLGAHALQHARRRGLPSVAVFQTDVAGFVARHGLAVAGTGVWGWLRHVHAAADLTLAPSSATIADLAAHGIPDARLWGRGVDATTYHPSRRTGPGATALRRRLLAGAAPGTILVGYVGRLAPEKEVERIAALTGLPGVRVMIVGDGPSRPTLERTLAPRGVHFTGALSGTDLADAYAALDVFVHTGRHETFGQTLQEAMATALPVLAPAQGGPVDVVADGHSGLLLPPGDDAALVRAVRTLHADPALRARMGEAGRRRILPRTWRAQCEQLEEYYATAVGVRRSVGACGALAG